MTDCRVWPMYQARCLLCDWADEITYTSADAATGARIHRASAEHKQNLKARRSGD